MSKYYLKVAITSLCMSFINFNAYASDYDYSENEYSSWEVEISGSLKTGVQYSSFDGDVYSWDDDNSNNLIDANEAVSLNNEKYSINTDSTIDFFADYYFDTGMSISANISLETDEPNVKVKHQYLIFNLGLAYLDLGTNDSAIKQLHVTGSDPSAGFVDLDGRAVLNIDKNTVISSNDLTSAAGRATANADLAGETHIFKHIDDLLIDSSSISPTSSALKVSLISDIYSGFSFGASYTPSYDEGAEGPGNGMNTDPDNDPDTWLDNYELAGKFSREFLGMELSLSSAYYTAKSGANQLDNIDHDKTGYSVGVKLVANGIDFGSSYGRVIENYDDLTINSNDHKIDGRVFELAAKYEFDEISIGAGFFRSETDKTNGNDDLMADATYTHIAAGIGYNIADGLIIGVETVSELYEETDYNDVNNNNDNDLNEISAFMIGSYIATMF